jgi:hypothetical protein
MAAYLMTGDLADLGLPLCGELCVMAPGPIGNVRKAREARGQ